MSSSDTKPATYTVNLKVVGETCLVVGGGRTALRKVGDLLDAGAVVWVVSPEIHPELDDLVRDGRVEWRKGEFEPGDVDSVRLVIAATNRPEVNRSVTAECRSRGIWVNVVDDPENCDFFVPAVLHRGSVTVAVSTGGKGPALAGFIRDRIAEAVGPEYGVLAAILGELRERVRREVPEGKRRGLYKKILSSPVLSMIRDGRDRLEIMAEIEKCISSVSG